MEIGISRKTNETWQTLSLATRRLLLDDGRDEEAGPEDEKNGYFPEPTSVGIAFFGDRDRRKSNPGTEIRTNREAKPEHLGPREKQDEQCDRQATGRRTQEEWEKDNERYVVQRLREFRAFEMRYGVA